MTTEQCEIVRSQKLQARNTPSPDGKPSISGFVEYLVTNPSLISSRSIACTVPRTRGSPGGRKPTSGTLKDSNRDLFRHKTGRMYFGWDRNLFDRLPHVSPVVAYDTAPRDLADKIVPLT